MRIGIIWSWYDVAVVASRLPDFCDVYCFIDRATWPWTQKSDTWVYSRIEYAIRCLEWAWVDRIIVPPYAQQQASTMSDLILPLFSLYVQEYVLPYSRVGKLWLITVYPDEQGKKTIWLLQDIISEYTPSVYQQKTKAFLPQFPCRTKVCAHRDMHMTYAKQRSWIMRNLVKYDLRYFKDCGVDTILPIDRSMWYWEKMIVHRLGAKMKFHGTWALKKIIAQLMYQENGKKEQRSEVHIRTSDTCPVTTDPYRSNYFTWWWKRSIHMHQVENMKRVVL